MNPPSHDPPPPQSSLTKCELRHFARRSLKRLLKRIQHLLGELSPDNDDLVEDIHQLRVTSRKADVALRVFRQWIPRSLRRSQVTALKKLRLAAGAVRDLDLLEIRWRPGHGTTAAQVPLETAAWLHLTIQQQRSAAFHQLMRQTTRSRCHQRKKKHHRLLNQIKSPSSHRFQTSAATAIAKLVASLNEAATATTHSLKESHQTRIRARRLRYGLELLQDVIPDETSQLRSQLESLQEDLGELNDDATTNQFVRQVLDACHDSNIKASLQTWLDQSEAETLRRLAETKTQLPSPATSLAQFLSLTQ